MLRIISFSAAALLAVPATGEVVKATPAGFELKHTLIIDAPADPVWTTLVEPARWWSKDHTYSGDAANLSIDARAGGCFCERLKDGGAVEHMRVVYLHPQKSLRMTGGLGPLQAEGAQGAMTIALAPAGAGATRVTLTYVVGGYIRAGGDALAPAVDGVLGQQVRGLKAAAEAN